jgi:hypothetical protein
MRPLPLLFLAALPLSPGLAWAQGNPLGPEFLVNTYTTANQARSDVAADLSGNFVIVWASQGQDGSYNGVFGQRYASSGAPLGPEFRVNTFTAQNQDGPSIAADPAGNFVVTWSSEQYGPSREVFGQRYAASGAALGGEFRVNTFTTAAQSYSSVAVDANGNFEVVWASQTQDGPGFGVFGRRYDGTSGAPLGPEFRVNSYTTNDQYSPSIAADGSGNIVVVWASDTQDGSDSGIFGQRYASTGTPLGPEFRVNTYTTADQGSPDVAADLSGNFVIVWASLGQDGSLNGVFGQRYASSGAPLGPEFRVNTFTAQNQDGPSIAADPAGNFVVTWSSESQYGPSREVFGQRYAASGAALGGEFRVNTFTTGAQSYSSVAADANGNFEVVWASQTQDGSGFGVFGQRYSMIVPVELIHIGVE